VNHERLLKIKMRAVIMRPLFFNSNVEFRLICVRLMRNCVSSDSWRIRIGCNMCYVIHIVLMKLLRIRKAVAI